MPRWVVDSSLHALAPQRDALREQSSAGWVLVGADVVIALSSLVLAATLGYMLWRGRDLPFRRMVLALGVFLLGGAVTRLLNAFGAPGELQHVRAVFMPLTALAALSAAVMLARLVPKAIALARDARLARERGLALETSVGELGNLYEKARAAEVMKTRLFANVSHELRTPLTLLLGPAERMSSAPNLNAEQRRDLDVVIRNSRTLLKHVNDLLDVSRIESGHLELVYYDADAASLLRRASAHFAGVARERKIDLLVDCPEELRAQFDEDKIERVVLNLLSNAFKVTPENGVIRCSLQAVGEDLVLEVADSGPGIRESDRERVFERFEKLEAGPERQLGGTGLGLSIVREFVEAHAGHVSLDDAPEGGARFRVTLPRRAPAGRLVRSDDSVESRETRAAIDQTLAELRRTDGTPPMAFRVERPRVLVVEDNPEMNHLVRQMLRGDFQVSSAMDGESGLAAVVRERPDVVVTDLMMPRVSGEELVRTLRRRPEFEDLPILVVTAMADEKLRVSLLGEGSLDYILKPFSASELLARVRNLVAMKRARDVLQHELRSQVRDLELLAYELAEQKRELASTLDAMRTARDQAERASRVKSTFLRMVSHELRTPLAAIQLQVDRLARAADQFPEKYRELLLRCHGSIRKLSRLIEGVLEYTRMEGGRLEITRQAFNPRDVAEEVVALTAPYADQKSLTLDLRAPESLPLIETDPRLVRLVLLNLVENAVKFTERGEIAIVLEVAGSNLKLFVRDSGPGISEDAQALIFEPFEQIGPTENKHLPGIGLGLTLVREMVAALGGGVHVESRLGQGATFVVTVPIRFVEAVA
ncbi:MAG TPA: ATP-binding protein [Polyangiaceae bacterium]|nr:ATP-binding protein [Polyangiaceae bacterium]